MMRALISSAVISLSREFSHSEHRQIKRKELCVLRAFKKYTNPEKLLNICNKAHRCIQQLHMFNIRTVKILFFMEIRMLPLNNSIYYIFTAYGQFPCWYFCTVVINLYLNYSVFCSVHYTEHNLKSVLSFVHCTTTFLQVQTVFGF